MKSKHARRESFTQSLPPILLFGVLCAAAFYGLILTGPLDYELLRRYCLNHPVAVACVFLFFTGIVTLSLKSYAALIQSRLSDRAALALRRLTDEGAEVRTQDRSQWLQASWNGLPKPIRESWLGQRLLDAVQWQLSRGRRHQVETDLEALADAAADRQYESYGLLRIINWAMPMLGFLGTVLGISQTLGQLDTELLATQQQQAMNELTAGLYVAFDTTAVALILTVFLMFLQFGIGRLETNLLSRINNTVNRTLVPFLGVDPYDAQATLLAPVRDMASDVVHAIESLTHTQAEIWERSITESQKQWQQWTETASSLVESHLSESLESSLHWHVDSLRKLHEEANEKLDLRWQQWQTTLSDQARLIKDQQHELLHQTQKIDEVLNATTDLVSATSELRRLEDTIHDSVSRLEHIGRLEHATNCVGEAVAVLATSLERAGVLRGAPTRPRVASSNSQRRDTKEKFATLSDEKASNSSGRPVADNLATEETTTHDLPASETSKRKAA